MTARVVFLIALGLLSVVLMALPMRSGFVRFGVRTYLWKAVP